MSKANKPVLVTTAHRGVFFGWAEEEDCKGDTIDLHDARCALYWSADVGGFMGLAESGPTGGCRIGATANIRIRDVTSVCEVTDAAAKRWKEAPCVGR